MIIRDSFKLHLVALALLLTLPAVPVLAQDEAQPAAVAAEQAEPAAATDQAGPTPDAVEPADTPAAALEPLPGASVLSAGTGLEQELIVTREVGERIRATFTRRGARLMSLELIEPDPAGKANYRYRKTLASDSDPWQMVDFAPGEQAGGEAYYNLSTGLLAADGQTSLYDDAEDGVVYALVESESGPDRVTFRAELDNGLAIAKSFSLRPDVYSIDLKLTVENRSGAAIAGRPYINIYSRYTPKKTSFMGPPPDEMHLVSWDGAKREDQKLDPHKLTGEQVPGTLWVGFKTNYWLNAVAHASELATQYQAGFIAPGVAIARTMTVQEQSLQPGQSVSVSFNCFGGPMIKPVLVAAGSDLSKALYFGWFTPIALGMLWFLELFFRTFNNWGVAIIIVTVIIRVALFPLTHKSMKSMRGMAKLQPLIKELREKYKDDKDRLNREMMGLYRTHKINPAGGCLPLLIQFPIFIAFYRMLSMLIELRHAPFIWWITDLSAPDVAFHIPSLGWGVPILPFLMGASMYFTQKLTPSNPDPTQQKVMQFMPLFFLFIFIKFPSGLVLYWFVSNMLGIAQQLITNRLFKDEPLKPALSGADGKPEPDSEK